MAAEQLKEKFRTLAKRLDVFDGVTACYYVIFAHCTHRKFM